MPSKRTVMHGCCGAVLTLAGETPAPVAPDIGDELSAPRYALRPTQSQRVYSELEVDEPPELVTRGRSEYPQELLDEGVEGVVSLQAIVGVDGNIEAGSVRIVDTTDERFNEPTLEYVTQLTFTPGQFNAVAVRVLIQFPIQYSLIGG